MGRREIGIAGKINKPGTQGQPSNGIKEYYADSSISEQDVLYKLQFNLKLNKHGTRGQALNGIQEHYADNSTHKF